MLVNIIKEYLGGLINACLPPSEFDVIINYTPIRTIGKAASKIMETSQKRMFGIGNQETHQYLIRLLLNSLESKFTNENEEQDDYAAAGEIDLTKGSAYKKEDLKRLNILKDYNFDILITKCGVKEVDSIVEVEKLKLSANTRKKLQNCLECLPTLRQAIVVIIDRTYPLQLSFYEYVRLNDEYKLVPIESFYGIAVGKIEDDLVRYLKRKGFYEPLLK